MLGETPHMHYAGANVNLTITTDSINLMVMETGEVIHSFAYKIYVSLSLSLSLSDRKGLSKKVFHLISPKKSKTL